MTQLIVKANNGLDNAEGYLSLLDITNVEMAAGLDVVIIGGKLEALLSNYERLQKAQPLYIAIEEFEPKKLADYVLLKKLAPLIEMRAVTKSDELKLNLAFSAELFTGVIFCLNTGQEFLWHHFNIVDILRLIRLAKNYGLSIGFGGSLALADVSRLLPYEPEFLFIEDSSLLDGAKKLLLASTKAPRPNQLLRIYVRDYILDLDIGVYQHEHGAKQRVCFNVVVEAIRSSAAPEHMEDIFSYDVILDAILDLSNVGHIDFVESLAEQLCSRLLAHNMVWSAQVRVEKLDLAPRAVGVEISRTKADVLDDIAVLQT